MTLAGWALVESAMTSDVLCSCAASEPPCATVIVAVGRLVPTLNVTPEPTVIVPEDAVSEAGVTTTSDAAV